MERPESKLLAIPNAVKMQSNRNFHSLLVGMKTGKPLWKTVFQFPTKLNIFLPCDPAIALLGIKNSCPHKSYARLFIALLFTIAKT